MDRVKLVHSLGFIHRDLKPENMLVGRTDPDTMYLIDFGLAKRYQSRGRHIRMREGKCMVGAPRYASINALTGVELSRRDDIESMGYVLLYLYLGTKCFTGIGDSLEAHAEFK